MVPILSLINFLNYFLLSPLFNIDGKQLKKNLKKKKKNPCIKARVYLQDYFNKSDLSTVSSNTGFVEMITYIYF